MRISVKIDGLEYLNTDVMMILYRSALEGSGFGIADGAKVEILAQNEKVEGMILYQSYIHAGTAKSYFCSWN